MMKITTGKTVAGAIFGSILLHIGLILTSSAWLDENVRPASAPPVPSHIPRITQQGITYAWLAPPQSPSRARRPEPPPFLSPDAPPITTPASPDQEIYEASRLSDTPEPIGEVPLDNLPPGVSSSGEVELSLLISSSGEVLHVDVTHSSLDPKALALTVQAFRDAPFRPGTFNGVPVTSRIKISVRLRQE